MYFEMREEESTFHVVDLDGCELRMDDNMHFNAEVVSRSANVCMIN